MSRADCISRLFPSRGRNSASVAVAALLAGGVCLAADPGAVKVKQVRFWSLGEITRVAVEVNSDFKYRYDRLSDPDRIFFDIQDARPEMTDRKIFTIPVGDPLLKQIRIAETQPGITRVVLDVEQHDPPVQFTASQLSGPARLIIELRLKDKPAPPATPSVSGAQTIPDNTESEPVQVAAKTELRRFEPLAEDPAPAAKAELKAPLVARQTATVNAAPAHVSVATPSAPQPTPAKRNSKGEESLTRVLGLKLGRVVIDAGHGGHDEGTRGPTGLTEKEVVLDIAQRLGALLQDRLSAEVVYTRQDDTFIPLEERTRIANEHKADLFLSIHANSSPVKSVSGVESYYLNFTTSQSALDVAARENATSQGSIFDLQQVLQKIAVKDKIDESREFATRIQNALFAVSAKSNAAAKNRGVKRAPFVVLIGASMPSVLAEIGFLTNASDEALLRNPAHRQKIAEALFKGIASYADTLSHFTVAQRDPQAPSAQ
ncbi:MAG: N-acetylmuramoyl-L-alanine amidase [Bryobacterales bacterium]|nr:N-acetylmuramoyl-L-alanine amidase [Bryobacterales bacterium]